MKLVESGCLQQTPRMAVPLFTTTHLRSLRGLVGDRSLPLQTACAHTLASTSGKGFGIAGTVYAHRVSRAFRHHLRWAHVTETVRPIFEQTIRSLSRRQTETLFSFRLMLSYLRSGGGSSKTTLTRIAVVLSNAATT